MERVNRDWRQPSKPTAVHHPMSQRGRRFGTSKMSWFLMQSVAELCKPLLQVTVDIYYNNNCIYSRDGWQGTSSQKGNSLWLIKYTDTSSSCKLFALFPWFSPGTESHSLLETDLDRVLLSPRTDVFQYQVHSIAHYFKLIKPGMSYISMPWTLCSVKGDVFQGNAATCQQM